MRSKKEYSKDGQAKPLIPVILAGGSGTRLWPLSRQLYPKQFLPLLGEKTMLQQTIERLQGLDCQAPIIVYGGEKKQARTFFDVRGLRRKTRRSHCGKVFVKRLILLE
ncbi:sugar phosphate nucleotidyltransferase [Acetomicrobium sp.]|uniref:sugar phosphate nucleotidyltransferase n=1 Tax=Acetomicrobium sp. TaxID=1872099 RepID=UPI002FC80D55